MIWMHVKADLMNYQMEDYKKKAENKAETKLVLLMFARRNLKAFTMWFSTVFTEMPSLSAISL